MSKEDNLPKCPECGERVRVRHDGSCYNCGAEAFPPLQAYEYTFGKNLITGDELRQQIWRFDWGDVFQDAVESRPNSWGFFDRPANPDENEYPVAEWRNAMDELKSSLARHLQRDRGLVADYMHRNRKKDFVDQELEDLYVMVSCPECGRAVYTVVKNFEERDKCSMFCWRCGEVQQIEWRRRLVSK